MKAALRVLGTFLVGGGVLLLAWAGLVWQWQDPLTALYATYQQNRLAASYARIAETYRPPPPVRTRPRARPRPRPRPATGRTPSPLPPTPAEQVAAARAAERGIAREAARYQKAVETGQPLGRITVPRLGLSSVVVTGTDTASLTKGPGWDQRTSLPGLGRLVYVAGHRTTYLAPFADIERLRPGDRVTLELPYATFVYAVSSHVIVPASDVGRLRTRGREEIALQACHPRFFATQRYIVYARPTQIIPRGGSPYFLDASGRIEPLQASGR